MTTRKQSSAFPTVAQIRKGAAKNAQGHVGPDLKDKFRIVFFPGVEASISSRFSEVYQELGGLQPTRIRAMIPAQTVWEGFTSYNETYNANIRVAQADDEHYINLRDPGDGYRYLVRDGEPFKPYTPGDVVTYKGKDGRTITLKIKVYNRLKLFLPEIEEFVYFEFRSTAYYDRENIKQQLGAIQEVANLLNNGVAAGVPFFMYRSERDISYIDDKGEAKRTRKWLIQLKADPEYVKSAIRRMSSYALTGQGLTLPLLGEADELPLEISAPPPGAEFEEDEDDEEGVYEATARDVPPPPAPKPTPPTPPPARRTTPRPPASSLPTSLPATKNGNGNGNGAKTSNGAPGSPLAEFNRIGAELWPGKWDQVWPSITNKTSPASLAPEDLKKALEFVQKRQTTISADFDELLKHIEKAWPVALSFAPLAWGEVAQRNGIVDPLLFVAAISKATDKLGNVTEPKNGAAIIISHYPEPKKQYDEEFPFA